MGGEGRGEGRSVKVNIHLNAFCWHKPISRYSGLFTALSSLLPDASGRVGADKQGQPLWTCPCRSGVLSLLRPLPAHRLAHMATRRPSAFQTISQAHIQQQQGCSLRPTSALPARGRVLRVSWMPMVTIFFESSTNLYRQMSYLTLETLQTIIHCLIGCLLTKLVEKSRLCHRVSPSSSLVPSWSGWVVGDSSCKRRLSDRCLVVIRNDWGPPRAHKPLHRCSELRAWYQRYNSAKIKISVRPRFECLY